MKKISLLFSCLVFGAAVAQIEVDISPNDLLSGAADARLQELGAQAAEEELPVTITAPSYWHELITEQIRAGAGDHGLEVRLRETLVESVIVRLGSGAAARAVPSVDDSPPTGAAAPTADSAPAPIEPERPATNGRENRRAAQERLQREAQDAVSRPAERPAGVPKIAPEVRRVNPAEVIGTPPSQAGEVVEETDAADTVVDATGEPQQQPIPPATETGQVAPAGDVPDEVVEAPEAQPEGDAPAAADPETTQAPAAPEADEAMSAGEARASLQERLNDGRPITKTLSVGQLRRGDQVFTTGGEAVVVRATRVGRNVYWLDGELDTEAEKLRRLRAGKYEVLGRLDAARAEPEEEISAQASGQVEEDAHADERSEMEARYNEGRPIESTLPPARLQTNDMLYVGDELIVVIRRDRIALKRYWLDGDIDLQRDELEQVGNRKYRVQRTIR